MTDNEILRDSMLLLKNMLEMREEDVNLEIRDKIFAMETMTAADKSFTSICNKFISKKITQDEYDFYEYYHERAKHYYNRIIEDK